MNHDILIVDDEKDIRDLISGVLEDEGYQTRVAATGTEALKEVQNRRPQLVVLDVWLGDSERDGLKILELIKRDHPYTAVIIISGHGTIETAVSAIKKGAYDFIEKPFKIERLLICVRRALEAFSLKFENDALKKATESSFITLGQSQGAHRLRADIEKCSISDNRIFFEGAQGSGKSSIAKIIHKNSKRSQHPFIVLNCVAISPIHLDAELFGVDIMGASKDTPRKIGLLEQAHNGTILLEEVHTLPLSTQSKISKFIQTKTFTRAGSGDTVSMNVRIMATSSIAPSKSLENGTLSQDLYYRLNATTIHVPSIVDRLQDLPLIVENVLESIATKQSVKTKRITEDAMTFLQMYHWPYNFQELQNSLEVALINAHAENAQLIDTQHLPTELVKGKGHFMAQSNPNDIVVLPIKEARELFERDYLQAQVNRFGGNITQTAKFIGMERSALHRKLKALGFTDPRDTLE